MARLSRFTPAGIPQHIIQRGNNRQRCFSDDDDYLAYLDWLFEYAKKFELDIHAYVLMTNHVHLLATPHDTNSISQTMQSLGRQYVRYFNRKQQRTGTLWEGRYRASLVDTERYLLECYRYIELNPVRSRMVSKAQDYRWSSYRSNALGEHFMDLVAHEEYQRLGKTDAARYSTYQALFPESVDDVTLGEIRNALNKGMALGSNQYKDDIETLYKRRVRPARLGRPVKKV